jgi:hypothetical protein
MSVLVDSASSATRDERFGQPSASARYRLVPCPGSVRLAQRYQGLVSGAAAALGELWHEGLEGIPEALIKLALDNDFQKLRESYTRSLLPQVRSRIFGESPISLSREHRAVLYNTLGQPIFSARWDLMLRAESSKKKFGLIVEYKTGFFPVPEADRNLQTRAQAALANYEEERLTGRPFDFLATTVFQRGNLRPNTPIIVAVVDSSQLRDELELIRKEVAIARGPNPALRTGQHCALCPVPHACPAFRKLITSSQDRAPQTR